MNQTINLKEVIKQLKYGEDESFGISQSQLKVGIQNVVDQLANDSLSFDLVKRGVYLLNNNLPQKLVVRKINSNLKRLYKDIQANRRVIIAQVITLLGETCPFWVIKTDIRNFYESIDRKRIVEKLQNDAILPNQSLKALKILFAHQFIESSKGVPRGLSLSSTLAEIYMRRFDKWAKRCEGVYYYARYVDDIIVFCYSKDTAKNILQSMPDRLRDLADGLEINMSKTSVYESSNRDGLIQVDLLSNLSQKHMPLDYLGYEFSKNAKPKDTKLIVSIASKKVKKIKSRIVWALLAYSRDGDFQLLSDRMIFLSGNYGLRQGADGNDLRAGIFYNYHQINDYSALVEVNRFFRKAIFSTYGVLKGKHKLTMAQKTTICKYCFVSGFKLKIYRTFAPQRIIEISNCW
jgi:hypothetical protein